MRAGLLAWALAGVLLAVGTPAFEGTSTALADERASRKIGPSSGLPLPRYVSLKSDRVNLRKGPGTQYPTAWVFRRAGWPLEVVEEFEGWRQVRDADGTTGWVLQAFLSGRRTALVLPWELKTKRAAPVHAALRGSDRSESDTVALVEAGVTADIMNCSGRWCSVTVMGHSGWIEQSKLWGVYPGEVIE